mmetsp:Transcript_73102/g.117876  ORF Transcript_73102/g.117876 Transcript_73102/m.117876 type:complete len:216 (-) Transcript_73102:465-1112(-)
MHQVLPCSHNRCVIAVNPWTAQGVGLDVLQEFIALLRIRHREPQSHMLHCMVELQVDNTHLHDHHLPKILVFQDGAKHRIWAEFETDGATPIFRRESFLPSGLHLRGIQGFSVNAMRGDVHGEVRLDTCCVTVCHAAVDNLLHFHLDSVHLALRFSRGWLLRGSRGLVGAKGGDALHEVICKINCANVDHGRREKDVGFVPHDGLVQQRPPEEQD